MPKPAASQYPQETLLPPEVVQVTVRIGFVGASGHCQWLCEARNATDGELLAMVGRPHFDIAQLDNQIDAIREEILTAVRSFVVPF